MFAKLACVAVLAASALAAPHGSKRAPHPIPATNGTLSKRANTGKVTWYGPDESDPRLLCEPYYYSDPNVKIVALRYPGLINNANKDQYCGKSITVQYQGKTVQAVIQDGCASCTSDEWIDLSPGAISVLDPNYRNTGQFQATWWFNDDAPAPEPTKEPTSTWTPPPEPTSTWTPPPPTSTWTPPAETSTYTPPPETSTTSSYVPSSTVAPSSSTSSYPLSSVLASYFSAQNASMTATASLNATATGNVTLPVNATASLNATAAGPLATASSTNKTATINTHDNVVTTADEAAAGGNLALLNNVVASVANLIRAGSTH